MKNDQVANDHFNRSASMGKISHLPGIEIHKHWKKIIWFLFIDKSRKETCKTCFKSTITNIEKMLKNLFLGNITGICSSYLDFHIVNASLGIPLRISLSLLAFLFTCQHFLSSFSKAVWKCDFVLGCFCGVQFIYLLLTTYVFINVQLLYSKIMPAQNLLSLNEEEGL